MGGDRILERVGGGSDGGEVLTGGGVDERNVRRSKWQLQFIFVYLYWLLSEEGRDRYPKSIVPNNCLLQKSVVPNN